MSPGKGIRPGQGEYTQTDLAMRHSDPASKEEYEALKLGPSGVEMAASLLAGREGEQNTLGDQIHTDVLVSIEFRHDVIIDHTGSTPKGRKLVVQNQQP